MKHHPAQDFDHSFHAALAARGDAVALLDAAGRPTRYADLAAAADGFAAAYGRTRRLVAVEAAPTPEAVAAYLGALRGGHAVLPLPACDPEAAARAVARFRPDVVARRTATGAVALETGPADLRDARPHPDLALLLETSGSTGEGKGVRLSYRALAANAAAIASYLDLAPDDRSGLVLPLHYSYGLSVLNSHLAVGASVALLGGSLLDADFAARARAARVTNLSGVPYSFELMERAGLAPETWPDLRFLTVAGGRLAPDRVRDWATRLSAAGKRLYVMYGQTEATARIAWLLPAEAARRPDSIGVAIPGGALSLIDETGEEVTRPETPGELVYRGPNVMMGYATSRADLARGAEVAALRTGDLAVRDADGFHRIVGRLNRMSKIAGVRVQHDALEAALASEGATAAAVGDDRGLRIFVAAGMTPEAAQARAAELCRLPLTRVTAEALAPLPRRASGKIDYAALRARPAPRPGRAAGALADELLDAYRQTFHPRPVAPSDSFAGLGGDSLRHVEIALALEARLGATPAGWEHMAIADLARPPATPRAADRGVDADLMIRALAILLVCTAHQTLWPIPGGAAAMVVLIGYNLARFQRTALAAGDFAAFFRPLGLVLAPYYVLVAAYAVASGQIPWASVALIGNFGLTIPETHLMLPYLYWFVEAFAQIWLLVAAAFLLPPVRRMAAADPFRLGLWFLGAAVAARVAQPFVCPLGMRDIFTVPWVLHLCALGWLAACADTPRRKAATVLLAAPVLAAAAYWGGNWVGSWIKFGLQLPVLALLLYAPRVPLPKAARRLILPVAAASFQIYLTHRFAPELILAPFEANVPAPLFDAVAIAGGVALGLGAHRLQLVARRRIAGWRERWEAAPAEAAPR